VIQNDIDAQASAGMGITHVNSITDTFRKRQLFVGDVAGRPSKTFYYYDNIFFLHIFLFRQDAICAILRRVDC
jgi:hypothetical protein